MRNFGIISVVRAGTLAIIVMHEACIKSDDIGYRRVRLAVAAIERGARLMGIGGREMHDRLKAQNLIENYLLSGYESMHTQGFEYVAESTVETLRNWEGGQ